ncbi:MAG: PAS sensor protein [Parcubacteria group bacterium GW2011_GWA1_44_13]|nr:MAG: PAS sensor protein [Parcubacteria group bacterium GW2011_GWA1_44_13]
MFSPELIPIITILVAIYIVVVALSYWGVHRIKRGIYAKDSEMKRRLYELAILKEISDRTGYSLNIQKILDVIVGSLNQFLEYSAVSYMLLEPSKVVFKADIEKSVSTQFIKDVRTRMLGSLSALLGRDLSSAVVEETITGAIMIDALEEPVRSYFNIPLVIGDQLVGVLTVSHTKAGLYKESEMEILYKIVNQASQAVGKLEEVVKTEQGKIAAMLESMLEGVVMTDKDYHVIAANPASKIVIGYKGEAVPTIFNFMDAFKGVLDIRGKLEEAIKLDKILTIDEVFFGGKYYQVVVSPVKSNVGVTKGEILGGVVIFHDVTHEKEAEKMRSDFTSMMVHELRSPLGNIKKIGEMMRSSKVLEDKQASSEYVSMLYESSSSMLDLVNDLLDVAKLESGKFSIEKSSVDIKEILSERVKFFETSARDAGINMSLLVAEGVPNSVSVDAKRITQVLNNLFSNALIYTLKGGTVTAICFLHKKGQTISGEAQAVSAPWISDSMSGDTTILPDSVVVAVTDTGEGITPENIEKLFNKFTQFASSARDSEHKGTGLGLVIVKGIVEAHDGVVRVGSKLKSGSTFYFTIPL